MAMTFLSVCYTNIRTNSTYYLQHTTDWTELNVLLYDGTHVLTGLLLCVWLRFTTLNKVNTANTVNICALDLSKAFDKVNHQAL